MLLDIANDIMALYQTKLREKLVEQGHRLTGALEQSLQYSLTERNGGIIGTMIGADYSVFVQYGVKAENIPYTSGGPRRGGKSQYIQGLVSFFENRGLSGREALGAAFATAAKHEREGMPTRASSAFSQTGRRTGFVTETLEENETLISQMIEDKYGVYLELQIGAAFDSLPNVEFYP